MKLVVGLGNPGKKYEKTRHNVGFMVLDALMKLIKKSWRESKKAKALYCKAEIDEQEIEFLKPTTYMNNSGAAVAYAVKKHPTLKPADIVIIHDDKDLPLGEIRVQTNRGPAGHNGVKSIIEHLGTQNFTRIRVGTASDELNIVKDTSEFVLDSFLQTEKNKLEQVISQVNDILIKMII